MTPQCDEIFKQKVNDCVQHIVLQKSTNFHAIWSWSFQNICNEIGWPRFLRHPVILEVELFERVTNVPEILDIFVDALYKSPLTYLLK